jgi:hypothetical protein
MKQYWPIHLAFDLLCSYIPFVGNTVVHEKPAEIGIGGEQGV